jgi:hypothetical protein
MTDFTAHFRFQIPDFNQDPWHAELEAAIRAIDTAIYEALLVQNVANWANSTVYAVGAIVIDPATGLMWTCGVANTSSASPTTFAQERVAHPTFWNVTANIPQQRGTWVTATSYIPGDFVVDSNRYAVCLIPHVSGVFNTDLAAARWVVLIDLSSLGVGLNATAEDTIAAAGTTDIGSKAATRLSVTGSAVITSFGVVANTYKILRFAAGSTLTNNANIILFSANITTEANDIAFFSSNNTGVFRLYFYSRASGVPLGQPDASETVKGIAEIATTIELAAGVDDARIVTPAKIIPYVTTAIANAVSGILGGVGATLDTLSEIATAIGLLAPKANPTFTGTIEADQLHTTGVANLAGGTSLPAGDISLTDLTAAARAFETQHYHIREEQTNGTDSGALTSGAWNTRVLNTEKVDDLAITPSSNQLSLAAGTWRVKAEAVASFQGSMTRNANQFLSHKLRIRNITDGATLFTDIGQRFLLEDDGGGNNETADLTLLATLDGTFTIAGTKTIELQSWVVNSMAGPTTKGGRAISSGETEVYVNLKLYKVA